MKEFSCGDVVPGCTVVFRASTENDILQHLAIHADRDHNLKEIPDALLAQIRTLIHEVPAA